MADERRVRNLCGWRSPVPRPLFHAVLRLLARQATPPDCRAGASRTIPTSRPDRGVRRRQPAPPPPMLPIFMHAPHASPPATRRAFSQLSIPPASQDSAFSDKKAVGQDAGLYPPVVYCLQLLEVVLSRVPTAQGSSASITQRTRTPFLRSNTLQQKPRNMNKNLGQKNASPAQRGPRRENMYMNRSRSFAPSLWVR